MALDVPDVFFDDYHYVPEDGRPTAEPKIVRHRRDLSRVPTWFVEPPVIQEELVRFLKLHGIERQNSGLLWVDLFLLQELGGLDCLDNSFDAYVGLYMAYTLYRRRHGWRLRSTRSQVAAYARCIDDASRYLSMRHQELAHWPFPRSPVRRLGEQRRRLQETEIIPVFREAIDQLARQTGPRWYRKS